MKLGSFKRIISTDFEIEQQPLVEQLATSLNDSTEQVFFALENRLTFDENFLATVKDVEITVGATGIPTNRTSILLNTTNVVKGTLVISAVNKSNASTYPTGTPFISFTQSGQSLYIDNITNLQTNNRYLIKLIAFN